MRSSFRRALLVVFVLLTAPSVAWILASGPSYTVEDLGPAGTDALGRAINAAGAVAGSTRLTDFTYRPFTHDPSTGLRFLPAGDRDAQALAINAGGAVAGTVTGGDGLPRAFRFDTGGGALEELPTLGGSFGRAQGINDSGVVVGYTQDGAGSVVAFRAAPGEPPAALAGLESGSFAYDVNAAGQVVGEMYLPDGTSRGFVWDAGAVTPLGTLGGTWSVATAVNATPTVAGSAARADGLWHAFTWTAGVMTDVGTLGGPVSGAEDVNDAGAVVGWSMTADGATHAFVYTAADGIVDLNDRLPAGSGWTLAVAHGINDAGQITGYGYVASDPGVMHAFRLTPDAGPPADTTPPVVQSVVPSTHLLWPPNHQLVLVDLSVAASDDSGEPPTCAIDPAQTRSSEPDAGLDDGDLPNDVAVAGDLAVRLRAERWGSGTGRVYTLGVVCRDAAGNSATAAAYVKVPHSSSSPSTITAKRARRTR